MKDSIKLLFLMIFIILSCTHDTLTHEIKIQTEKDTVEINEVFEAHLSVDNYGDILPEFFIISRNDPVRLIYYDSIDCAVFKSESKIIGEKNYEGYANYNDKKGENKTVNFQIKYYVK